MTHERSRDVDAQCGALVEMRGITKAFAAGAVRALNDVSLAIRAGEFFTLLGPSGCGKTTLLRMLAGFEHPDAGSIELEGRCMLGNPPNKRPINIVFQSYALFPHMSVAANVAFGMNNRGIRGVPLAARTTAALRLVQLEDLAERRPSALSGGQQQRVALARAIAPEPRLLLLDEPLSALDPKLRRGMQVELKRIQRETGITFLLVTHDQEEALSLSDRIAVMDGGRIRQIGAPADIYERPRTRFVADFMGANIMSGARLGMLADSVAIRPEHVRLARAGSNHSQAGSHETLIHLPGRVESVTFLGGRTACRVALDAGGALHSERGDLPVELAAGDPITCGLPQAAIVALDD